jgi:hypothetical protein
VNTRARLLLLSALLALGLALGTVKKARSLGSPDFKVFYTAARHALADPENIYRLSPDRYLYPPSTALVLTPFAFTDHYAFHQWAWHALLAALVFALAALGGPALAAMAVLTRYLAITFSYGQINLVVIALLALTGYLAKRRSPRASAASGAIWALVTSLKIYPVVLAPFFFPRGRRLAWAGAALAGAFLLLLPFVAFGPSLGAELYRELFEALRAKGLPTHSHNQSIAALLLRLFTKQMFYLHAVGPAWWGVADLPVWLLRAAALLIGAALALVSWRRAWRRGLGADAALSAAAFSVLFLSHIVWKDYLLFLYFPLREGFAAWPRRKSLWVAGAFLAMITLTSPDVLQAAFRFAGEGFAHWLLTEPATIGHALSVRCDAACVHLWAAVLVWVAWCKQETA